MLRCYWTYEGMKFDLLLLLVTAGFDTWAHRSDRLHELGELDGLDKLGG